MNDLRISSMECYLLKQFQTLLLTSQSKLFSVGKLPEHVCFLYWYYTLLLVGVSSWLGIYRIIKKYLMFHLHRLAFNNCVENILLQPFLLMRKCLSFNLFNYCPSNEFQIVLSALHSLSVGWFGLHLINGHIS